MWIQQLPLAEQMVCLGWLLFLVPEYDGSKLWSIIQEFLGEEVALCYHSIQKGTNGSLAYDITTVKAIHMEVGKNLLPTQCQQITSMYSSSVQTFPLDIKMCLVPKFSAMPKSNTPARALMLMDHQAWFLLCSTTSKLSLDSHNNLQHLR